MTKRSLDVQPHSFNVLPVLIDLEIDCVQAECRATILVAKPPVWIIRLNYLDTTGVLHREDSPYFVANPNMFCPTCEGVLGEPQSFETEEDATAAAKTLAQQFSQHGKANRIHLTRLSGSYTDMPDE